MPMQNLIRQIVDMDAQAQKITDAAQQEKLSAEAEIATQTAALQKSYWKQSRRRLEMMNESERTILEQRWRRRRDQYAAQQKKIEQAYTASRADWVNEVVKRTLSDDR